MIASAIGRKQKYLYLISEQLPCELKEFLDHYSNYTIECHKCEKCKRRKYDIVFLLPANP
jgi:hypothetical protein